MNLNELNLKYFKLICKESNSDNIHYEYASHNYEMSIITFKEAKEIKVNYIGNKRTDLVDIVFNWNDYSFKLGTIDHFNKTITDSKLLEISKNECEEIKLIFDCIRKSL